MDWGGATSAREHRDRLLAMRAKSGMHVGALPREFTKSGLAKFGAELSSDEEDENILLQGMYTDTRAGLGGAAQPQQMPINTDGMSIFALGRGVGERTMGMGAVKWQASAGASATAVARARAAAAAGGSADSSEHAPHAYDSDLDAED